MLLLHLPLFQLTYMCKPLTDGTVMLAACKYTRSIFLSRITTKAIEAISQQWSINAVVLMWGV